MCRSNGSKIKPDDFERAHEGGETGFTVDSREKLVAQNILAHRLDSVQEHARGQGPFVV